MLAIFSDNKTVVKANEMPLLDAVKQRDSFIWRINDQVLPDGITGTIYTHVDTL